MTVVTKNNGVFIIEPDSRLDTNTSPEIEQKITEAVESGETKVIFDFANTDYISSAGLRVVLKTAKILKPKGGHVVLCNSNEQIDEVLEISAFLMMVKCHDTLDKAIASFG